MNLGIVGTMMSGKTTLANILVKQQGFERVALADAVKDDCVLMLNTIVDHVQNQGGAEPLPSGTKWRPYVSRSLIDQHKPVFRTLLQWYGTDFWREYMKEPDHWLWRLKGEIDRRSRANRLIGGTQNFVVDDVRFVNEGVFLKEQMGFRILKIVRPEETRQKLLRSRYPDPKVLEGVLNHPSETEVDSLPFDFVFENTFATVEELTKHVDRELIPLLMEDE